MGHTEYMRIWRAKNHERWLEITRKAGAKWRKKHPRKRREKARRENDQKNFGGMRYVVLARDRYSCVECGRKSNLSVDHKNGDRSDNRMRNLQTLCLKCHGHKDGVRGWKWVSATQAVRVEHA